MLKKEKKKCLNKSSNEAKATKMDVEFNCLSNDGKESHRHNRSPKIGKTHVYRNKH